MFDAGPLRSRNAPRTLLLCLAAGAAHAASFAPAELPLLELLALAAVLQMALWASGPRLALGIGLAFGLGWFGVGVSWIFISLHKYGGLSAPLAAAATGALATLLALFPALALTAASACGAPGTARRALALAACWTLADWLRGVVLGGMPWIATGYAHTAGPLAGYAPIVGVYGVGAAAASAVLAALWAWSRRGENRPQALAAAAFAAAILLGGWALRAQDWTADQGKPIRVRLVQGNIAQDVKFGEAGLESSLQAYLPALQVDPGGPAHGHKPPPDLIVLPESAFPLPVGDLPDEVLAKLADIEQRDGAALIFGAFVVEPPLRYFNSAIGLGPESIEPQRYSKRHLVPFGEFVPYGFHWFVTMLRIPIGDQERGAQYQAPMALAGQQIAVTICFEDLFGAEILDAWHDRSREPTLLLNLSNLAWFDDSIALPQHLQISRMRALETGRPLIRATNTGITAIIDAHGAVTDQLAPLTQGSLEGWVQGKRGLTPFIRAGNLPILLLAAGAMLACIFLRRQTFPTG